MQFSLPTLPPLAFDHDVVARLLGRDENFFLNVSLSFCRAMQSVLVDKLVPNSALSSVNVVSGRASKISKICSVYVAHAGVRSRFKQGAVLPSSLRSCLTRRTQDSLTLKCVATSLVVPPESQAANTSPRNSFEYEAAITNSFRDGT